MGFLPIRFDHQSLLLPEEVHLEHLAVDLELHIALRQPEVSIEKGGEQACLQDASQGSPFVNAAPGKQRRAQNRSSLPTTTSKHAIDCTNIQQTQHRRSLNQAPQGPLSYPPCHID